MAEMLPPIPHSCEILLKSKDRADACPEIDRCQIEITLNDDPGLEVVDGAGGTKLVRVFVKQESAGCDALVRVGMVEAGGPIAFGSEVVSLDPAVYAHWERRLRGCVEQPSLFLGIATTHLLNVRYVAGQVRSSLLIAQLAESWQVIVDRQGPAAALPLRLEFYPAADNLIVSAALSQDLNTLYVVESRQQGPSVVGTWHKYGWNRYANIWTNLGSGSVPFPTEEFISSRPYYVDRYGRIGGFWWVETSSRNENDSPDAWCQMNNDEQVLREYIDYDRFGGDLWSIEDLDFVTTTSRRSGVAVVDGDVQPVIEYPAGDSQLASFGRYSWTYLLTGDPFGEFTANYGREQELSMDRGLHFRVRLGRRVLAQSTDFGNEYTGSAQAIYVDHRYHAGGHWWLNRVEDITFGPYINREGSVSVSVTPGGWVCTHDVATLTTPVNATPVHTDSTTIFDNAPLYAPPACVDMVANILEASLSVAAVDEARVVYPVSLGEYFSIEKSFSSVDQQSGEFYCGVYVKASETAEPEWRVYKNGKDYTASLASCLGRPLDQLCAIYWRA